MPSSHDCCLCSQIAGDPRNDLIASLLPDAPYVRRIMLEDASFAVMPDLGPPAPAGLDQNWIPFDGSIEALSRLSGGSEYVRYETPAGSAHLWKAPARGIESQQKA